ncbi:hypothetical protein LQF12_07850 [Ruania suaedae]|uniref:hypothetical protein n=1 Tax=Ruania suaedae TaxID=2897774 RepID=UPI001E2EF6E8|nr:hypothetical protein [Ruania suaedae]UFU04473.1 hypothetical protein LQF12_07850 [Ruania suaedae]
MAGPHVEVVVETADGGSSDGFEASVAVAEPGTAGLRPVTVTVRHTGAEPVAASVRLSAVVAGWSPGGQDPWWLIPGAFYGENRPAECERTFPRFALGAVDPEAMVSPAWELRADRAATPAVFGWSETGGVALVAPESSPLGMTGLGLAADEAGARVHLRFPFSEHPVSYDGSQVAAPAEQASHTWQPGESHELTAWVAELDADRHGYAGVLRAVHGRWAGEAPIEPWVSIPEAAHIAAEGLVRWHYDPDPGVLLETMGFDRGIGGTDRQAMHIGWISGIPWAQALLGYGYRAGDAAAVGAAERVIDFCTAELAPCGTFWGTWYRASGWAQSWSPVKGALHARTLGEAALFLVRALGSPSGASHPQWRAAAVGNLDVMTGRQRADGNLGTLHHMQTGQVMSWSGAAGLTWVAALCEAGEQGLDEGGRYLAAAERAGEYYAQFVEAEFLYGAPEDVDLAPSSEDGYAAVLAYVALHRRTGEGRWLDLARRAADWLLTFRYTYNTAFDPRTPLGMYGFARRGADNASPSNPHLHAYGLVCTAEMLQLAEALGDSYYAERALEHLACFRQCVPRVDGEMNAYRGMITERYYQTAAFQPKGMILGLSHAWCVGVLLLGAEQALGAGHADA